MPASSHARVGRGRRDGCDRPLGTAGGAQAPHADGRGSGSSRRGAHPAAHLAARGPRRALQGARADRDAPSPLHHEQAGRLRPSRPPRQERLRGRAGAPATLRDRPHRAGRRRRSSDRLAPRRLAAHPPVRLCHGQHGHQRRRVRDCGRRARAGQVLNEPRLARSIRRAGAAARHDVGDDVHPIFAIRVAADVIGCAPAG
mmetsp:Transcript_50025/g.165641  ORF Transcript_50025/g.165641 Transcript_50025/m.165641 type:complete len:200 (-) Transcript_50025:61-660(-)